MKFINIKSKYFINSALIGGLIGGLLYIIFFIFN